MSERVANLEMQVSDLQARVMSLEKQISTRATSVQSKQNIPAGKTSWRSLQKGMSKDDVRRIMGEPKKIEVYSGFEYWYYGVFAKVEFDDSGLVTGWTEPSD